MEQSYRRRFYETRESTRDGEPIGTSGKLCCFCIFHTYLKFERAAATLFLTRTDLYRCSSVLLQVSFSGRRKPGSALFLLLPRCLEIVGWLHYIIRFKAVKLEDDLLLVFLLLCARCLIICDSVSCVRNASAFSPPPRVAVSHKATRS